MAKRVVADTNIVVSGLLWSGSPRELLDITRIGKAMLFSTMPMLSELEDVLSRPKLRQRLNQAGVTPRELVLDFASHCQIVRPTLIAPAIKEDPDDDAVLACAASAAAELIVSGDHHLLALGQYAGILIVTVNEALSRLRDAP